MKAMIFAAGLGSRLKPLTDTMPKALVPVAGRPMLEHVILKLKAFGFTEIVINIHHFGEQILEFLKVNDNFGLTIHISDERDVLLDTGGGIRKASSFFENSDEPFLVHNVDILSNVDLKELYDYHLQTDGLATLLVSQRKTSRYLLLDAEKRLCGWINKDAGQVKPEGLHYEQSLFQEYAFSGIHVLSPAIFQLMEVPLWGGKFSIMDFYLATCRQVEFFGYPVENMQLIDIGKPETLAKAEEFIRSLGK